MKIDTMGIGTPISKKDLKELTKETKETIATNAVTEEHQRPFGAVDMWNVRKRQRTSASLSRWLN